MPAFREMSTEDFARYIGTKLTPEAVIRKNGRAPKAEIRGIASTDLPEELTRLTNQILASEQVFDVPSAEANTTLAPHTPGKMRSYHGNVDGWLPHADITKATTKSRRYADYIATFKGQPNNLKGKAGGDTGQTGYIEYTGAGWRMGVQHGRLVYNYYEDLIFLTLHYQPDMFYQGSSPFVLVQWRLGLGLSHSEGTVATQQAHVWALASN